METNQFNINVSEVENGKEILEHKQKVAALVRDLKDIICEYVEEEQVTPGEFVASVRDALRDCYSWHDSRLRILKDAETLLLNNGKYEEEKNV